MSRNPILSSCPDCGAEVLAVPEGKRPVPMRHAPGCPHRGAARRCDFCAGPMVDVSDKAEVCQDRCRAGRWKWRKGYGLHQRPAPASRSNGRPRPSGLQVSYRKAVDSLTDYLDGLLPLGLGLGDVREEAEAVLRPVLSDRQRAQLEERS